jgi:2-keto-3-deoxy-L-rhamnonate aldolase RhmA
MAAAGVLGSSLAAQQPGGKRVRLNQIIEQFEQGRPSFTNEHWHFFTLTNSLFLMDDLEKLLADLRVEGGRPRLTPIVRIPYWGEQDYQHMIKPLLTAGVMGIIVPEVHTKEQALKLVKTMRYPPQRVAKYAEPAGNRGCCPGEAPRYWGLSLHEYFLRSDVWPLNPDGELLAIVMIESQEAIKNINDILSVPGLGGALIGPHDLSLSLGVGKPESNPGAPEVEAATATFAKACAARKALCGTFENPDIDKRLAQGFRLFPNPRTKSAAAR